MNVRLVVPDLAKETGGIGRYGAQLRRALSDQGIDAQLAPFRYLPGAERISILKTIPIGIEGTVDSAIIHLVRAVGASMLLFHCPAHSVVTVHDLGMLLCPEDRQLGSRLDRRLQYLSHIGMRRASRIIAVSEFTKQCLIDALDIPASKIDAIPNGVDTSVFKPVPDARAQLQRQYGLAITPETRLLLYVGSEMPRKSLPTLMHALGHLKRQGDAVHWIKVGLPDYEPGHRELLRLIEEHQLQNDVTFLGKVPDEHLPLLYSAADIYVHPSVWEGFGLPVLEAMACGTPVVAANATSVPEVVGDAVILVEPRNPEALASGITRLLTCEELAVELSRLGQQRAALYPWKKTAMLTAQTYSRLLTQPAGEKISAR